MMRSFGAVICTICLILFATSDADTQQGTSRATKAPRKKKTTDASDGDVGEVPSSMSAKASSSRKSAVKAKSKKVSSERAEPQKSSSADVAESKEDDVEGQQAASSLAASTKIAGAPSSAKSAVKAKAKKVSTSNAEHQSSSADARADDDLAGAASHPLEAEDLKDKKQVVKAKPKAKSIARKEDHSREAERKNDDPADLLPESELKPHEVEAPQERTPESSVASKSKGVKALAGKKSGVKAKPAKGPTPTNERQSSTLPGSDHVQSDPLEESSAKGTATEAELPAGAAAPAGAPGRQATKAVKSKSGEVFGTKLQSGSEVPACAWTAHASCLAFTIGKYTIGQLGVDSCPPSTVAVKDAPTCQHAAKTVGFPWNTDVFDEGMECYVCLGCAATVGPDTAMIRMNGAHGLLAKWICQEEATTESTTMLASTKAANSDDSGEAASGVFSSPSVVGSTPKKVAKVPRGADAAAGSASCDGIASAEVMPDGSVRLAQPGCSSADATSGSTDKGQQRAVKAPKRVKEAASPPEVSTAEKVASSAGKVKDKAKDTMKEHGSNPPSAVKAPVSVRVQPSPASGQLAEELGPTLQIERTSAVKAPRHKKPAKASSAAKVPVGSRAATGTSVPSTSTEVPSTKEATRVAATKVPISGSGVPASATSAPTKLKKVTDAGAVAAGDDISPAGKRAPAERMLSFASAALHASRLDAILDCSSWHSCLDIRAFQKAAHYGLNNAILARRNVDADRGVNQPPGMGEALDKAVHAVGVLDDLSTEDAFDSAVVAFTAFFGLAGGWLAAVPAASIKFSGTYNSVKLPAGAKESVDVGRILIKLRSGGSMPMLGFGTQCLAPREVGRSVRWALKAGFRHIAVDVGAEAAVGEELARFAASAAGTGAKVFVSLRLADGVWQARGGTVAELLAAQLKALRLPSVDLLVLPSPGSSPEMAAKAWREMEALHAGGRAKALGAANFSGAELEALMSGSRVLPDVALATHSVYASGPGAWDRAGKDIVLHVARPKGTIVSAEGVLSGGADSTPPPLEDPHVQALAKVYETTPAQLLLRWAAQRGLAVLPCSKVRERIEQDVDVFGFEIGEFDMALLSHLAQLAETTPGHTHRPPWTADVFALGASQAPKKPR